MFITTLIFCIIKNNNYNLGTIATLFILGIDLNIVVNMIKNIYNLGFKPQFLLALFLVVFINSTMFFSIIVCAELIKCLLRLFGR